MRYRVMFGAIGFAGACIAYVLAHDYLGPGAWR